jgi:hypothetical protein
MSTDTTATSTDIAAMSTDIATLVADYIQAVGDHRFEELPARFHPDIDFSGPGVRPCHGAPDVIAALRRLTPILVRNDIKHIVVQGDEACVIYDFVTNTSVGPVPSVEWLKFEHDRIRACELTFDHGRWPEVLQVLQAQAAQS